MKIHLLSLPMVLTAFVLSGCPDSKMPKVPPSAPEPKAEVTRVMDAARATIVARSAALLHLQESRTA